MYRKLKISTLFVVFAGLLILTLIVKIAGHHQGDRTLKAKLTDFSFREVTTIRLYPKNLRGAMIVLQKENNDWFVEKDNQKYSADSAMIQSLVEQFGNLTPMRMAATQKDKWASYEVTDSLATRIIFENAKEELATIRVGKFSYRLPKNQQSQSNPYARMQGTMNTYVRINDDKEVYAVEGFLGMQVNRDINDFRNKTLINESPSLWNRIVFDYPADSAFVLKKENEKWMINEMPADSAAVEQFLNNLRGLRSSAFTDSNPATTSHTVRFEGPAMKQPLEIRGLFDSNHLIINSSANPETFFQEHTEGELAKKVFVARSLFIKQ